MNRLTIAYITSRLEPKIEWFFDSLERQLRGRVIETIVIDFHHAERGTTLPKLPMWSSTIHSSPKPTIWQGAHRVTTSDWWANSNARNTAFCLCQTGWIAFVDDRSFLLDGYLDAIERAMKEPHVICGSYEKRVGLEIVGGEIANPGTVTGVDSRREHSPAGRAGIGGGWLFGANFALPLEWALEVNGFEEAMDGLSMEDSIFGMMLHNQRRPMVYDPKMAILEDRTIGETQSSHGIDGVMKRADKGQSPSDKSHAALKRFGTRHATDPLWTPNLRAIRAELAVGRGFPVPPPAIYRDWFDDQVINGI